jgi:hypothetical protein
MKKETTNPTYASYKSTNLVNYLNESGTGTLSQTFMPSYSNNAHDLFPCTSIFATTIDGELTDVINIKDCFNKLPKDEKLKIVSVLLEFCAAETSKLTKPIELPSDWDIDKEAFKVPFDGSDNFYDKSFIKGAKWMKEEILNQNK